MLASACLRRKIPGLFRPALVCAGLRWKIPGFFEQALVCADFAAREPLGGSAPALNLPSNSPPQPLVRSAAHPRRQSCHRQSLHQRRHQALRAWLRASALASGGFAVVDVTGVVGVASGLGDSHNSPPAPGCSCNARARALLAGRTPPTLIGRAAIGSRLPWETLELCRRPSSFGPLTFLSFGFVRVCSAPPPDFIKRGGKTQNPPPH